MSVPCEGCGREYDVTLFAFGRTISCTCGRRVALAPRERALGSAAERRFLADAMLGRLARWLRLLGFDCAWEADVGDEELVLRALREGRILLSRDRRLADEWRVAGLQVVDSEDVREQLREVLSRWELAEHVRLLTRCAACNERLRPAEREAVAGRVPPRVLERQGAFAACPRCDRVYWEGTHAERIRRVARGVLESLS